MADGRPVRKALVAGWFSYEPSDYTAGDLLAADVVCEWLREAGFDIDVARVPALGGGVDLEAVDPADAIVDFALANRVDHVLIGARDASLARKLLGSVSAKVAAEASCSVTIVRPPRAD